MTQQRVLRIPGSGQAAIAEAGFKCQVISGISDHRAVLATLNFSIRRQNMLLTTFRDFQQADDVSITDLLAESFDEFQLLSTDSDVHTIVCYFETLIKSSIERFVPLKTKKKNTKLPWMNSEIVQLSRCVRRLRRAKRADNIQSIERFTQAKEELRCKSNS